MIFALAGNDTLYGNGGDDSLARVRAATTSSTAVTATTTPTEARGNDTCINAEEMEKRSP